MQRIARTVPALTAFVATFGFLSAAWAGHSDHRSPGHHQVKHLAIRLESKADLLEDLIHDHYDDATNWGALDQIVEEFELLTDDIKDRAQHERCDMFGLQRDLASAKHLFAQVEQLTYAAERCVCSRHHHKHGIARHIRRVLAETGQSLVELCNAVDRLAVTHPGVGPGYGHPGYGQPGWGGYPGYRGVPEVGSPGSRFDREEFQRFRDEEFHRFDNDVFRYRRPTFEQRIEPHRQQHVPSRLRVDRSPPNWNALASELSRGGIQLGNSKFGIRFHW